MNCQPESEVRVPEDEFAIEVGSAVALVDDLHTRIQFLTRAVQEYSEIYLLMCRMSRNEADARELTQDAYVKLCRLSADEMRAVRNVGAFLYTLALRVAQDWKVHGQRQKRKATHEPLLDEVLPSHPDFNPDAEAELMQLQERLEKAVRSLPSRQQMIFIRCEVQACPVETVADEFGCSAVTVRRVLAEALATLRESISHTDGGPFVRK